MTNNKPELWDMLDKNGNKTGRTQERGWLGAGNYHLIVHIWINNSAGQFMISKRTPNKRWPNMWGCTIGSAVSGDDSLTTALKEVQEEIGIVLDQKNGQLFKQYRRDFEDNCGEFIDVWVFDQEIDALKLSLQPDEVCDAKWSNQQQIKQMIDDQTFLSLDEEACPYINELFSFCEQTKNKSKK